MANIFSIIGNALVRRQAKRDVSSGRFTGTLECVRDQNNPNVPPRYACSFFRKELDSYYAYCSKKRKNIWKKEYSDKIREIEDIISQGKYAVADNESIGIVTTRLNLLKSKEVKGTLTEEESKEIADRISQIDALKHREHAAKRDKFNKSNVLLAEIDGIIQAYENSVVRRKNRCLERMTEYWDAVLKYYKPKDANQKLSLFRWSIESLTNYFNMNDPFDDVRKKVANFRETTNTAL